jgi:hypothetical protein
MLIFFIISLLYIIIKVDLFKGYINIIYVDEGLKLISRIVMHHKQEKKVSWRNLIEYFIDEDNNNLKSRMSSFQHMKINTDYFGHKHNLMITNISFDPIIRSV